MHNHVSFRYDARRDVILATPRWHIVTEEDCRAWLREYEAFFTELGRGKLDVVFSLDHFSVDKAIAQVWGRYRADMVSRFTRHSVRVHPDARVRVFAHTSGILHQAGSDEAPDVETAVARILELRARAP